MSLMSPDKAGGTVWQRAMTSCPPAPVPLQTGSTTKPGHPSGPETERRRTAIETPVRRARRDGRQAASWRAPSPSFAKVEAETDQSETFEPFLARTR